MIPRRIKLCGFLCYKEPQNIDLGGSSLWMLSGQNGSGKSSVFDAVTYALFGHHRGGSQQYGELINKDSQEMAVEFDFTVEDELYQARRTLKRSSTNNRSTQQISHWNPAARGGQGDWKPVPDTNMARGFGQWVADNIGLSYETFTSSVLLLQGRAEKLLDSTPRGRSEVLASIVDLARYQRLHDRADAQRKSQKSALEGLRASLASTPEVTELALAAADERIAEAERGRHAANERIEELRRLEGLAAQWRQSQGRVEEARQRLRTAESLVSDAEQIERGMARLRDLREALPHAQTLVTQRRAAELAAAEADKARAHRDALAAHVEACRKNAEDARAKLARAREDQQRVEARHADLVAALNEQGILVSKLNGFDQRLAATRALEGELLRLPGDAEGELRKFQQRLEGVHAVKRNGPLLKRIKEKREAAATHKSRAADCNRSADELLARGKKLAKQSDELKAKEAQLLRAGGVADDRYAEARALAQQARAALDEFSTLQGARLCRSCGQPLTPAHFAEEQGKRRKDSVAADKALAEAKTQRAAAAQALEDCRATLVRATEELVASRTEYKAADLEAKSAERDRAEAVKECSVAYADLDEPFRVKVADREPADWSTTIYPVERDLGNLRAEAANERGLREQLAAAESRLKHKNDLRAQVSGAKLDLEREKATLPAVDFERSRQKLTELQAEDVALKTRLHAARQSVRALESECETLAGRERALQQDAINAVEQLSKSESRHQHAAESARVARRSLPASWQAQADGFGMADLHRWKGEQDALVEKDTETRYEELQKARIGLEALAYELAERAREQEAVPAEARRDPAEVRAERQQEVARLAALEAEWAAASKHKGQLDGHIERRAKFDADIREAEREHNYQATLAQLLGRDRLQRHLLRQAERQIVDYANGVLDRLSGGQLMMQLVGNDDGDGTDHALDLEVANRSTGGSPINVAFLSGSQRFRVAVSLALGIGQFASRSHRPIESVIIDEGFGCLDRQGRQVMIQELQNLRGHLHCILLVSHQEEFAEAFADGYQFELENGATRVRKVQR